MDALHRAEILGRLFQEWQNLGFAYAVVGEGPSGRAVYLVPVTAGCLPGQAGWLMAFELAGSNESILPVLQHVVAASDEAWVQDGDGLARLQ